MSPTDYTDHDFRPALHGWRLVYLTPSTNTDELFRVSDLAGWLTQLETEHDEHFFEIDSRPRSERPRRIVAANVDQNGDVYPCQDDGDFWMVLGPSQPLPTEDQAAEEIQRRRTVRGLSA